MKHLVLPFNKTTPVFILFVTNIISDYKTNKNYSVVTNNHFINK